MKEKLATCFLALFCFIAGLFLENNRRNPVVPNPLSAPLQIDTVFVEILDTVLSHPAEIQYILKEIPADIDTAAILHDYFAQRIFEDTIPISEQLTLSIRDTVSENSIFGRSIGYDLRLPVITKTFLKRPDYSLFILADTRLTPSLVLGYKQISIQAGYDFGRKEPFVGVGLKLWER
ncbi:hypothetical protein FACS1894145_4440 [Bacteroidia bacterium]|nr:hypothetical protein FACS1894145_4440 [Bacteroidia bacterium]